CYKRSASRERDALGNLPTPARCPNDAARPGNERRSPMTNYADDMTAKFFRVMEQMSDEDRQLLARAPIEKTTPKVRGIFRGSLPDDDPIYERGWTFILGKKVREK